jgi:putative membrane protein
MLWLKAFHIFFVVSWFAGLFYLPRIFVNLAMVPADSAAERDRLLVMARKLYKFVTPIAVLAVITGLWLWFGFGFAGGWLHVKTSIVVGLVVYHLYCGVLLKRFIADGCERSHVWFRFFNEVPVFGLLGAVLLVVLKPF